MDSAQQGSKLIEQKDFAGAIEKFTKAITTHPEAPDYYIKRSTAYSRLSPPDNAKALSDAEAATVLAKQRGKREAIAQAQLRRGIVYFALERYGNASKCFEWAKKLDPKEKTAGIWEARTSNKISSLSDGDEKTEVTVEENPEITVQDIKKQAQGTTSVSSNTSKSQNNTLSTSTTAAPPDPATHATASTTPANKIRHDWYQTNETITIDVMAKAVPKDRAQVDIQPTSLSISFPLTGGSDFDLSLDPLFGAIDPSASTYKVLSTKIQCSLKKANPGQKWHSLEGAELPSSKEEDGPSDAHADAVKRAVLADDSAVGPAYPTSSKYGPKDWEKVATDLTRRQKKESKDGDEAADEGYDSDGGDPVNGFFKKLYKGLDPDAQRAMIKSYQESNGTALSTNWEEVKKGKVETSPPDGMEAKKWGV